SKRPWKPAIWRTRPPASGIRRRGSRRCSTGWRISIFPWRTRPPSTSWSHRDDYQSALPKTPPRRSPPEKARTRSGPGRRRWLSPTSTSGWPTASASTPAAAPGSAVRVPPLLDLDLRVDVGVLGLAKGIEAFGAELAADPGVLEPAEGPGVIVGQRVVDPD